MFCPNDNTEMYEVRVDSHYGLPVWLDQCPTCGGIWFDKAELFMARHGEAEKVEMLDAVLLANKSEIQTAKLICPRDKTELVRFTDRYFPQDIILVRCPVCDGMWLNRGEFVKFQTARQELQRSREKSTQDNKFEKDIKNILEMHRSGSTSETITNLGKFLSTPVDELNPQAADGAEEAPAGHTAMDTVLSILSMVLSAVMRVKMF
jgi:Zn-finger nucleic acid-binding protein